MNSQLTQTNFLMSSDYNSLNKDRRHSINKMTGQVISPFMDSSRRDTAPFPARLDNQASSTCRCYNFMGKTSFLVRKTTVITVADEPPAQMKKEPLAGVSGTGAKPLQEKEKRP